MARASVFALRQMHAAKRAIHLRRLGSARNSDTVTARWCVQAPLLSRYEPGPGTSTQPPMPLATCLFGVMARSLPRSSTCHLIVDSAFRFALRGAGRGVDTAQSVGGTAPRAGRSNA